MFKRLRSALQKQREARRNRVWVILINEEGPLLLSPAYFKWYQNGKDQIFERKPSSALSRLGECFPGLSSEVTLTYFKRFTLKGGSVYKDLHVFYAVVPVSGEIPKYIEQHLNKLRNSVPQEREVKDALDVALVNDQRYARLQEHAKST